MRTLAVGLLLVLVAAGGAQADPAVTNPAGSQGVAVWTFSNPANYTLANASLVGAGASLAWTSGAFVDTSETDFSLAQSLVNVNLTTSPGDVAIANTSQPGAIQSVVFQPGPATMSDNYLYKGNGGNPNYGTSPSLHVGNWGGGEWTRSILQFPAFPIPANASLVSVDLQLYMYAVDTTAPMDISVHRMTSSWTELGSNWNTRDGVTPWNTTGGDFDPTAVALVPGVAATMGWYTWNITSLAQAWWAGTVPNQGLMVRQANDNLSVGGEKWFASSDNLTASVHPILILNYTMPSSTGVLVSRVFDAGGASDWGTVSWNASLPAGTTVTVQTRTGGTALPDATWSAWSSPYAAPGAPIVSPPARYIQYRAVLASTGTATPLLHDVGLGYGRYAAVGIVRTEPFAPEGLAAWDVLDVNGTEPAGAAVAVAYSPDDGASWVPVLPGANLSDAAVAPISLRITLTADNTTETPIVASLSLGFYVRPGTTAGGGLTAPADVPWWIYLVPLAAVLLAVGIREARRPKVEEVFVVHVDGLLLAHRYHGQTSDKDDDVLMAMFTAIQTFIREAFSRESKRELKSMRIGDRNVEIVRGQWIYLAVIHTGERTRGLERAIQRVIDQLEAKYGHVLRDWSGTTDDLRGLKADVNRLFPRASRKPRSAA